VPDRPFGVIFDRRDAPTRTVGLPSAAERLDLFGQSGSLPSGSFRARSVPTTEESGHTRPFPPSVVVPQLAAA
jgi:hypothetical protein